MSYIAKLQIDTGAVQPIGSSLFGICGSPANHTEKVVILDDFTTLIRGVTVHVKFTLGNTVEQNGTLTLKVGSTDARTISFPGGSTLWDAGAVISFTYDDTSSPGLWVVNGSSGTGQITGIAETTYNPNSTAPISGQGVKNAFDTTLKAAAYKNVVSAIVTTGANINTDSTDLPTTAAVTNYINNMTVGLAGAMHFIGITTTSITDGGNEVPTIDGSGISTISDLNAGDVVLYRSASDQPIGKEYVWTPSGNSGVWELLGDEGSYALKSVTDTVIRTITFNGGAPTQVTLKTTPVNVLGAVSNQGREATAEVVDGVLRITTGLRQEFSSQAITEVDTITNGSAATLTTTTRTVVVPDSQE